MEDSPHHCCPTPRPSVGCAGSSHTVHPRLLHPHGHRTHVQVWSQASNCKAGLVTLYGLRSCVAEGLGHKAGWLLWLLGAGGKGGAGVSPGWGLGHLTLHVGLEWVGEEGVWAGLQELRPK